MVVTGEVTWDAESVGVDAAPPICLPPRRAPLNGEQLHFLGALARCLEPFGIDRSDDGARRPQGRCILTKGKGYSTLFRELKRRRAISMPPSRI